MITNDDPNKMALAIWEARKNKRWDIFEHLVRQLLESEPKPYGPSSARTFEILGESLEKQGRYEESIQAYEDAIKLNSNTTLRERISLLPFKRLDILYRRMGRYEECLKVCIDYAHYPWSYDDAWNRLQRIAKKLNRLDLVALSERHLNPPKGNIPLGQPLPRTTDEDVKITHNAINRAMESAKKHGSPAFVSMLDAKSNDNKETGS